MDTKSSHHDSRILKGSQLDLEHDCWARLEYAYINCNVKQYVEGHYSKYEDGKLSVCGIGFAMRASGMTDEEIQGLSGNLKCSLKTMFNYKSPSKVLKEFGFESKELKKFRTCPMDNCGSRGSLQHILEHINEAHRIPIPNIGKMIPIIREHPDSYKPTIMDLLIIFKRDLKDIFNK